MAQQGSQHGSHSGYLPPTEYHAPNAHHYDQGAVPRPTSPYHQQPYASQGAPQSHGTQQLNQTAQSHSAQHHHVQASAPAPGHAADDQWQPKPEHPEPYKLSYVESAKDTRTITVAGQAHPLYTVKHVGGMFHSGPDFTITSESHGASVVATIEWHKLSNKIELQFPVRGVKMAYRGMNGHFDANGGLGRVEWKITGMDKKGANWQLLDSSKQIIAFVILDLTTSSGSIEIHKPNLSMDAFEEVVVSCIAEIEDHRRMLKNSRNSAIAVGLGAVFSGAAVFS